VTRRAPIERTAIDLFAGGGGSSLGLTAAGFEILAAANHWPTSVRTHELNHPHTQHFTANLAETDFRLFPRARFAWGSPSCVWHARAGGRKKPPAEVEQLRADAGAISRATAFAIVEAAEVWGFDGVIVENVQEFADWTLFDAWRGLMHALGYQSQTVVLDSATVGPVPVAQHRKRLYVVFTRAGNVDLSLDPAPITPASTILDPNPGKLVSRTLYVADQLAQIDDYDRPHLVTFRKHARAKAADTHALATITAGGNHHGVATRTRAGMFFRMLTNRERARAQGFPDTYQFHGKADEVRAQIGNAVTVPVATWLGHRVATAVGAR